MVFYFILFQSNHTATHIAGHFYDGWASDPDDHKSSSVSCIFLGPNPVLNGSKKQPLVARSRTEAEWPTLLQKSFWYCPCLKELRITVTTHIVYCDKLSSVSLSQPTVIHSITVSNMSSDSDYEFFKQGLKYGAGPILCQRSKQKSPIIAHIPAQDQTANILAKDFSNLRLCILRDKLRMFGQFAFLHPHIFFFFVCWGGGWIVV